MPYGSGSVTRPGERVIEYFRDGNMYNSVLSQPQYQSFIYSRTGGVTPGFRQNGKRLPENTFHYGETVQTAAFGTYRVDKRTASVLFTTEWSISRGVNPSYQPSYLTVSSLEKDALWSKVNNACLLKIKDQSVNVAQFFAEGEQTVRLIKDNIIRIGKAYASLKHGDMASAARALGVAIPQGSWNYAKRFERNQSKALARGWLELQYGWLPLLSDIFGAVEQVQKHFKKQAPIIRVSSRKSIEHDDCVIQTSQYNDIITTRRTKYEVSVRCSFKLSQPVLKELNELGITNPLLLAWELTPFSFVVDWLLPIGTFLSALDATFGVTFVDGSTTFFEKNQTTRTQVGNGKKFYLSSYRHYNCESGSFSSHQESVSCTRQRLLAFPLPKLPVFKDPFSVIHFYNALSLLKLNLRK